MRQRKILIDLNVLLRALVFVGLLLNLPTLARAQTAFVCTGDIYQVQAGQLRVFSPISSTYTDIGPQNANYNGIGYNQIDNYIYGMEAGTNELIRIDANGIVTNLFSMDFGTYAGTMDDNGNLYVRFSDTQLRKIEIANGSYTVINLSTSMPPYFGDIVYIPMSTGDRIIGFNKQEMGVVNPLTGATAIYVVANLPSVGGYGATWIDSAGRLFAFHNPTGNVYEIKDYLTANPIANLVAIGTPNTSSNDGASCPTQPFPNLAPIARDDDLTTPFQTAISDNVLNDNGNGVDYDPDNTAITVTTTPVSPPSNGTLNIASNGDFTYTPGAGFSGIDQFQYRIDDVSGLTADAVVTITVTKAVLKISKASNLYTPTAKSTLFIPQNDVLYSITLTNTGNQATDTDSLFILDTLSPDSAFFNDDINSGGPSTYPGTHPIAMVETSSGLTLTYSNDVKYSDQVTAPTDISDCNYTPLNGYDVNIRHICIKPQGALVESGSATFYLRARIR